MTVFIFINIYDIGACMKGKNKQKQAKMSKNKSILTSGIFSLGSEYIYTLGESKLE